MESADRILSVMSTGCNFDVDVFSTNFVLPVHAFYCRLNRSEVIAGSLRKGRRKWEIQYDHRHHSTSFCPLIFVLLYESRMISGQKGDDLPRKLDELTPKILLTAPCGRPDGDNHSWLRQKSVGQYCSARD